MKRRMRLRARDSRKRYWRLSSTYPDSSNDHDDVLCPHGHPVDVLRASGGRLIQSDLDEWVAEHSDEFFDNWCGYMCCRIPTDGSQ